MSNPVIPQQCNKVNPKRRKKNRPRQPRPFIADRMEPDGNEKHHAGNPQEPEQTAGKNSFQKGHKDESTKGRYPKSSATPPPSSPRPSHIRD